MEDPQPARPGLGLGRSRRFRGGIHPRRQKAGGEFNASGSVSAGERLNGAKNKVGGAVRDWARHDGFTTPRRVENWVRFANVVALALAVTAAVRWLFPATMWVLPFAAFFVCSALSWRAGVGSRRANPAANCGRGQAVSTACW